VSAEVAKRMATVKRRINEPSSEQPTADAPFDLCVREAFFTVVLLRG
jgi:hypothetical protein